MRESQRQRRESQQTQGEYHHQQPESQQPQGEYHHQRPESQQPQGEYHHQPQMPHEAESSRPWYEGEMDDFELLGCAWPRQDSVQQEEARWREAEGWWQAKEMNLWEYTREEASFWELEELRADTGQWGDEKVEGGFAGGVY